MKQKRDCFLIHFIAHCLVLSPSFKKQYILIVEKIERKYKRKNENHPYTQLLEITSVNYMLNCLLNLSQ